MSVSYSVEQLKELLDSINPSSMVYNKCAYCGAMATELEHVVPRSWFTHSEKRDIKHHRSINNIVYSCKECNVLASNSVFENFWEKKRFLRERVTKRYYTLLKSEDWKEDEIEDLEGDLKRYIFFSEQVKKSIRERLINLDSPEIY